MGSGGKLARPGARTPGIYGIFGSEKQAQWTQQTYKRKERFTNPLHQIVDGRSKIFPWTAAARCRFPGASPLAWCPSPALAQR